MNERVNGTVLHGLARPPADGPTRPNHLDTSGTPSLTNPEYSRFNQMNQVLETIRSREMKIAVICDERSKDYAEEKLRVTSISTELNRVLCGSKVLVYEYTITKSTRVPWLSYLRDRAITHYIFVGLPQVTQYFSERSPERDFFNPKTGRVLQCVVVRNEEWNLEPLVAPARRTTYTPTHYLEKFLQLEGCDKDVTAMALCHFSCELLPVVW